MVIFSRPADPGSVHLAQALWNWQRPLNAVAATAGVLPKPRSAQGRRRHTLVGKGSGRGVRVLR